jgi:NTE family protein
VGTSAGSITGTLLRVGVPASELAAWIVQAPLSSEGVVLKTLLGAEIPVFEPFRLMPLLRRLPDPPGWGMLRRAFLRPWAFRPLAAALALLAPGRFDIAEQLGMLREVEGRSWPERDLWICAVRRHDGRRVVFGRQGGPEAPLHLAIAASCAVPGYFSPVRIDDHLYVDGGVHSPTNSAILRRHGLDLVIVVSPMSGPARLPTDLYGVSRGLAARAARREARALRQSGKAVVTFRPGRAEQAAMGDDFMSRSRVDQIVQESFLGAGSYAGRPEIRELLTRFGLQRHR